MMHYMEVAVVTELSVDRVTIVLTVAMVQIRFKEIPVTIALTVEVTTTVYMLARVMMLFPVAMAMILFSVAEVMTPFLETGATISSLDNMEMLSFMADPEMMV